MSSLRGFYRELDWSNLQRPYLHVEWSDELDWYIAAGFGDGNSDPVCMIEWDWTFTKAEAAGWRGRVVDWLQAKLSR